MTTKILKILFWILKFKNRTTSVFCSSFSLFKLISGFNRKKSITRGKVWNIHIADKITTNWQVHVYSMSTITDKYDHKIFHQNSLQFYYCYGFSEDKDWLRGKSGKLIYHCSFNFVVSCQQCSFLTGFEVCSYTYYVLITL